MVESATLGFKHSPAVALNEDLNKNGKYGYCSFGKCGLFVHMCP